MPTLNWIGKDAVVNHHREVPFHLLKDVPSLACGDPDSGNLILRADNLVGLKALLPYYAGRAKCVCIDPPYNTGNEGWAYNDNVNSPVLREWLGKVVGKEGETLDRHDRWLCMMYPRLRLLRDFLTRDGAIFVCIDDNEVQSLRFLMDEIFGRQNFIASVIWQKMDSPKNTAVHLSVDHDYILIYARDAAVWRPNRVPRTEAMVARYKNPDNDPRGEWLLSDLAARNFYSQGRYSIKTPKGRVIEGPPAGSYWRVSEEKFRELDRDNRIWWGKNQDNRPGVKRFISEVRAGVVPQTLWLWKEVGSTRHAKQELSQAMSAGASQDLFITPKPKSLMERVIEIGSDPGDLILDSFGGSGTTAHSVLQKNASIPDQPARRFIIVELDDKIAKDVTAKRVQRVAEGYTSQKGVEVPGLGGGFRYCELGEPLFDETGQIRETVRFADLARHVYFSETGAPLPKDRVPNTPFLGSHRGVGIYLLFNGIMGDKTRNGGNVLTRAMLAALPKFEGPKVIFCAGNLLSSEKLGDLGITVRQTPYGIRAS